MRVHKTIPALLMALFCGGDAGANGEGSISMPLKSYRELHEQATRKAPTSPAGFALGKAEVEVSTAEVDGAVSAEVQVSLDIRVYEDRWIVAPVLPAGTPVSAATVDDRPVQLVTAPAGLSWSTNASGTYRMKLTYQVDASRSEAGYRLSVPLPQAASTTLAATLPGGNLDAAIIPAAGVQVVGDGEETNVRATIPSARGVQISWRRESEHRYSVSRAAYAGRLEGDALCVTGRLTVDIFVGGTVALPLLPTSVTLKEALVDGKKRGILVKNGDDEEGDGEGKTGHFVTLIRGRGRHEVKVSFQVPALHGEGPPRAVLHVPQVPVSQFELALPGKKEVTVEPSTSVTHRRRGAGTVAAFNVPLTSRVAVRWSESVPEATQEETRANAEVYHLVHAEEGVLHARALVVYEVSRGQTNTVALQLPAAVQVNRVSAESGAVSDWRTVRGQRGKPQRVVVFLDRQVRGKLVLEAEYELLLAQRRDQPIPVPLSRVEGTHRQRGMVALLATKELALKPEGEERLSRVGENQLPALVRKRIERKVAHTYKYSDADPALSVKTATPTRMPGKFDAQVDTLVSLADVALQGSARVEVNVKSGTITALKLRLPESVNLLSLSAPSLRSHKASHRGKAQLVDLQFTQEMEGQFKIDVLYERILSDSEDAVTVPTLAVRGAEVEQGRIAVEALAAVEVKPAATDHLSSLDVTELPRQLVLKTTNPILLAYKYAHVTPPYRLRLRMTRHREVDVQAATIDEGRYQTLFTRDGLAVTRANFTVRNTRRQFLKVELPRGSEVWSAFVNGEAVKPALDRGSSVLIKIINSATGFPVELIYATRTQSIGGLGTLSGRLPRPDTVVTHTRWDVYVPEGLSYSPPETDMEVASAGAVVSGEAMKAIGAARAPERAVRGSRGQAAALRIAVPAYGVHYRFGKLYANHADDAPAFRLAYASRGGAVTSEIVSILATLAIWLGAFLFARRGFRNAPAMASVALGVVLLGVTLGYLQRGVGAPVTVSCLLLAGLGARHGLEWHRRRRAARPDVELEPEPALVHPIAAPTEATAPLPELPAATPAPEPEGPEDLTEHAEEEPPES
jgi:hypothetical protein